MKPHNKAILIFLVFALSLTLAVFTVVVKLGSSRARDQGQKPKPTPEQVAYRALYDDIEKLQQEVKSLRGELAAARAEVPPGQEVIYWWDNHETLVTSGTDNTPVKFGARKDGVLVWRYGP